MRNRRAEMNVPPSKKCTLYLTTEKPEIFQAASACICRLAFADELVVSNQEPAGAADMVSCLTHDASMFMPMQQLVDLEQELARIEKETQKAEADLARLEGKLNNEKFVSRAPANVVEAERAKAEKARALLEAAAPERPAPAASALTMSNRQSPPGGCRFLRGITKRQPVGAAGKKRREA